jgi:segregation and condensation protein A
MNQVLHSTMESAPHIRVLDEWQETIPEDLYIPPAAFEILLEHFEGPLDFLIYLIQKMASTCCNSILHRLPVNIYSIWMP